MSWMKTIVVELFGLFVDDGTFALTILIWLSTLWMMLPRLGFSPAWNAIVLFAGLALILIESVIRRGRRY